MAKLQLNFLNQTIVTVAFVSWPQNTSFSGCCGWRQTRRQAETEVFWGELKTAVTVVCFRKFNWNLAVWLPIDNALLT